MPKGLVTALRTLSALPVPGRDAGRFSDAFYWFPVVGLLLGLLQAGSGALVMATGWPELSAATVLLAGVLLTRGIHLDGMADSIDGFFGGHDAETRLRIMKDSSTGTFGVLALVLLLLFKWTALVQLLGAGRYDWVVTGVVLARTVQVVLAAQLPYARSEGGTAEHFVAGTGRSHAVTVLLGALVIVFALMRAAPRPSISAFAAASLAGIVLGVLAMRKIGGVTGDVLGASSESTETLVWIAGAFLLQL